MPIPLQTPIDSSLDTLIEKAKEDLARRLSIAAAQIKLIEATEVEWSDASLGCPQPGMEYAQVLTPGYKIRLQFGDREFEYHASKGNTIIYCENPLPPFLGTPPNI